MVESIALGPVIAALKGALLAAGAKRAAEEVAGASVNAGKRIFAWLKERLTGTAQSGLEDVCEKPESDSRWGTLESALRGAIEEDPAFRDAFAALLREALPEALGQSTTQTATVEAGSKDVKIAQVHGSGNSVTQ